MLLRRAFIHSDENIERLRRKLQQLAVAHSLPAHLVNGAYLVFGAEVSLQPPATHSSSKRRFIRQVREILGNPLQYADRLLATHGGEPL